MSVSDSVAAIFLDGRSTRRQQVRLRAAPHTEPFRFEVRASDETLLRTFDQAQVSCSARLSGVVRRLSLSDGGVLEVADDEWVDQWFASQNRLQAQIHRLERRWTSAWLIGAGGVLGLLLIWQAVLPWVVARIVDRVPWSAEQALGAQVLPLLMHLGMGPSRLDEARQLHYQELFAPLCAHLPRWQSCELQFRSGKPNAYALPGGIVIFTDDMITLLRSDEEFIAVAGHELGHVVERDVLHAIVRSTAISLALNAAVGDITLLALGGGGAVIDSINAGHSRAAESRADRHAFRVLRASGHNPAAFADVIERLQLAATEAPSAWLDSHPADADRIAAARAAALAPQ